MISVELDTGFIYDLKETDLEFAFDEISEYPFVEGLNGDFLVSKRVVAVREKD